MYKIKPFITLQIQKGLIYIAKYKVEITGINTSELKVLTDKEKNDLFRKYKNEF